MTDSKAGPKTQRRLSASARVLQMQDPVIPILRQLIDETPGTISLGQGIVHYQPPPAVSRTLQTVASNPDAARDMNQYGFVAGQACLLDRIKQKLAADNGIHCESTQIVFTAGSNLAFLQALLAVTDPGDEVILPRPYFFNHEMAIQMAGCTPVYADCKPNYQLDLTSILKARSARTRAIVTVSPSNPTGAVTPKEDLDAVNSLCGDHGLYHISDEAYEYFYFDGRQHHSPAARRGSEPHTISLFTLSKAFALAGWRAGYMHIPHTLVASMQKVQDTSLVCPPQITERVAEAALEAGRAWCLEQNATLESVRDAIVAKLRKLEPMCTVPPPQGAFYMLLKIDTPMEAITLAQRLIREFKVALLPGDTFGVQGCALRLSFASQPADVILEGVDRLVAGLKSLQ